MEIANFSKLYEYGLLGVVLGLVLFAVWKIIIWLMAFIKEDRENQVKERQAWLCRLEKQSDALDKIVNSLDQHDKRADERGRFVRSEHEKMMGNLEEQTKILTRINGYKDNK